MRLSDPSLRCGLLALALGVLLCVQPLSAAEATVADAAATTETVVSAPAAPVSDGPARQFLNRCAGCHSIGGGVRSGPDLLATSAWKPSDIAPAVKRMEKNTGPISEEDVAGFVSFLKDSAARDRLAAEESRAAMAAMAALEPASAAIGAVLFHGQRRLANGGTNCSACHAFGGDGGTLGPSLDTVHARLGDTALTSAIEKSAFLVMKPIYAAHPVTRQEAAHLTAFLATAPEVAGGGSTAPPLGSLALGASAIVVVLLALTHGRRREGTRARLVSQATRR